VETDLEQNDRVVPVNILGPDPEEAMKQLEHQMEVNRRLKNTLENLEALRQTGIFEEILPINEEGQLQEEQLEEVMAEVPEQAQETAQVGIETYQILYQTLQALNEMEKSHEELFNEDQEHD